VVLTGRGSSFSAGADLRRLLDGGRAYTEKFFPALGEVFTALFTIGKPVVAAEILAHKTGESTARKLILSAGTYGSAKAAGFGLVDHVFGADVLLREAITAARALADGIPADAFAFAKAQLQRDVLARAAAFDDDADAKQIWLNRLRDDWVSRYLDSLKSR
jgi:enoyl-CoA hydratase